jgi:hypothetical protein
MLIGIYSSSGLPDLIGALLHALTLQDSVQKKIIFAWLFAIPLIV